jgi:hypothetical protein
MGAMYKTEPFEDEESIVTDNTQPVQVRPEEPETFDGDDIDLALDESHADYAAEEQNAKEKTTE